MRSVHVNPGEERAISNRKKVYPQETYIKALDIRPALDTAVCSETAGNGDGDIQTEIAGAGTVRAGADSRPDLSYGRAGRV